MTEEQEKPNGVLAGRVAIVTGGGQGVGRGIALALASEGARVVVCGRTEAPLQAVRDEIAARGGTVLAVRCDVTVLDDLRELVRRTVEEFGGIHILVNNAMIVPHGKLLDLEEEKVAAAWESGPLAAFRLMRLCHPYLRRSDDNPHGGAVINLSSGASVAPVTHDRAMYAVTKSAINSLSRGAAVEWGPDGIRVNTIMPLANSPALERFARETPEAMEDVLSGIPLRRVGDPETDIGRAVVFLASPDASFVTSALLPLDGGSAYIR
ncbi:MAG: SDR family oxidoreductase [Frankia sp.]|nr:SDR family oxidoreductase [Frankia sp.]